MIGGEQWERIDGSAVAGQGFPPPSESANFSGSAGAVTVTRSPSPTGSASFEMCTKIKIFWKENFVFSAVLFFLSFTVR